MPNVEILTLHSSLQSHVQKRVFRPTKPGQWKIVLSTNIAETSVTVDDVTHVVDTGYHKEMCYDAEANMSSLQEVFVSRASAQQRAGRAGRVRAGHCWRLYSEEYFDNSEVVMAYPLPEIQRVPIEEVVLQVLLLELGLPNEFLSECPEPPSQAQVQTALVKLLTIKAILPLPNLPLTALGYHLAKLPVDVHVGKLLIMSSLLGCVEPALTIAAALGGKSPFSNPPNLLEEAYRAHCEFTNQYDENAPYTWTYQPPTNKKATYGKAARQKDDNDDANIYEAFFGGQTEALSASKKGGKKRDRDTQIQFSDHIAIVRAYNVWHDVSSKQGDFGKISIIFFSCLSVLLPP
jgi:HrpA-like RNA helicase